MLSVEIKITGTEQVIAKLRRLDTGLTDFRGAMGDIGNEVSKYYAGQVFASQGGAIGVRWPTLAVSTMLYKRKRYPQYATVPLMRTGAMQGSFTSIPTSNSVTIGNTAPYFQYHQSSAPRSKIPYRPMMAINNDVKTIVKKILEADVARKIQAA